MKNTEVEKIGYWSALVGQLDWSKNSRSHFKLILCCSLPNISPHKKTHPNRMKNTEVQITAEPDYSRLQGNKKYCLKEKSTITGIE